MTEYDPTAIDPDEPEEDALPPKPLIDLPPEDGEDPPTDQEEHEAERDFDPMPPDQAAEDPTVDDAEDDTP